MDSFCGVTNKAQALLVTDGSAIPNPGVMRTGILLINDLGKIVKQRHERLGRGTNNQAETLAFLHGLELALELGIDKLSCLSDSQLLVNQVTGVYKINKPELKELHKKVSVVKSKFKYLELRWHERESPAGLLADAASRGITFREDISIWQQIPNPAAPARQTPSKVAENLAATSL